MKTRIVERKYSNGETRCVVQSYIRDVFRKIWVDGDGDCWWYSGVHETYEEAEEVVSKINSAKPKITYKDRDMKDVLLEQMQTKIDWLMIEHCPEDMTVDQWEEWGKRQKPAEEVK